MCVRLACVLIEAQVHHLQGDNSRKEMLMKGLRAN